LQREAVVEYDDVQRARVGQEQPFEGVVQFGMVTNYLQLHPGEKLPDISDLRPFRSVVVIDEEATPEWQSLVSSWLVKSGCLYMMAWGKECSTWDDSVDLANLEACNYGDIPEDEFVMTTWHTNEPLREVFWFAKRGAVHPTMDLPNMLILHISDTSKENELISDYASA
jgi:hypothetical protein